MSDVSHFMESMRGLTVVAGCILIAFDTVREWRKANVEQKLYTQFLCAIKLNGLVIAIVAMFFPAVHFKTNDLRFAAAGFIGMAMYLIPHAILKWQAKRAAKNALKQKLSDQNQVAMKGTMIHRSERPPLPILRGSQEQPVQKVVPRGQ